eukprot:gene34506-42553_t
MLSNALEFLGWYGENWDAFWDSITALVEMPEQLRLIGWNSFETRFPRDAKIMKECLDDLSKQLAALAAHVEYSDLFAEMAHLRRQLQPHSLIYRFAGRIQLPGCEPAARWAGPAAQVLAQPVEEGFAHAVGRGAQAGALGHGQAGALPSPADDAHFARAFGGRSGRLRPGPCGFRR